LTYFERKYNSITIKYKNESLIFLKNSAVNMLNRWRLFGFNRNDIFLSTIESKMGVLTNSTKRVGKEKVGHKRKTSKVNLVIIALLAFG